MPARVVLVLLVASAVAQADPRPVEPIALQYLAPAGCPDEISLKAGVIARLGQDPFKGDAKRFVNIDVQPTAAGYVAAIELREPGREVARRAVGPAVKCGDAIDALELALAVIIDPTAGSPPPPPPSPPQPTGPILYEPPGWRAPPGPQAPPAPRVYELAIAIGLVSGEHPESEGYFGVRAGYRIGERWRIGLVGRVASGSGSLSDPALFYQTRTSEVVVEGCARKQFLMACGLVGVGSKSVAIDRYTSGVGDSRVADYSDPYGLAGANLSLEVPLGNAFLRPMIEGGFPLPNVAIKSEGMDRADLPIAELSFDLALGYRW